jgi:hypothetical protein
VRNFTSLHCGSTVAKILGRSVKVRTYKYEYVTWAVFESINVTKISGCLLLRQTDRMFWTDVKKCSWTLERDVTLHVARSVMHIRRKPETDENIILHTSCRGQINDRNVREE